VVKASWEETRTYIGRLYERVQRPGQIEHVFHVDTENGLLAQVVWKETNGIALPADDKVYFSHPDLLGSADTTTDGSGSVAERKLYTPFGNRLEPEEAPGVPGTPRVTALRNGYTSHEEDLEFGLVNMGGRLYDAGQHRFITPDPVIKDAAQGQAYHPYSYVWNRPTRFVDPTGFNGAEPNWQFEMRVQFPIDLTEEDIKSGQWAYDGVDGDHHWWRRIDSPSTDDVGTARGGARWGVTDINPTHSPAPRSLMEGWESRTPEQKAMIALTMASAVAQFFPVGGDWVAFGISVSLLVADPSPDAAMDVFGDLAGVFPGIPAIGSIRRLDRVHDGLDGVRSVGRVTDNLTDAEKAADSADAVRGGLRSVDPHGPPFVDPAPPSYSVGHPSRPVVDHIHNRARGGHPTAPRNQHVKTWEANSRKAGFEGNYARDLRKLMRQGLTRKEAEYVLRGEHDFILRDVHARPLDPSDIDKLPSP
jgi:RHS repeat-associated protein